MLALHRTALLVLALAATPSSAAPAVLLLPALGGPDAVTLQGRVLAAAPHGSSPLSRNLRSLTASNLKGARVELSFLGAEAQVTSDEGGNFQATLTPPKGRHFPAGRQEAQALVMGTRVTARVEVLSDAVPFLVISDFDDTLAVSEVTHPDKLLTNALLREGDTQLAVSGMAGFYGCLGTPGQAPAFALVSGSPVQFLPRVSTFLAKNGFPPGFGLYLRDLGPGTLSGYKQPILRELLRRFSLPVVLVGDSGEKDPEVYAQIRDEFPGRVRAIYIRDAGHAENAARFKDMLLFKDPSAAAQEAVRVGLASSACVTTTFAPVAPEPQAVEAAP